MAMDHKGPILGIDISPTVIKEMNEKHKEKCKEHANMYLFHDSIIWRAPVEYRVMDAVEYDFKPEYNSIIDKGTLDALNCGDFEIVEKLIMKMEYPFNSIDLKLI